MERWNTGRTVDIFATTWNIWGGRTEHTSKQQKMGTFVWNFLVKMTLRLLYQFSVVMALGPTLLRIATDQKSIANAASVLSFAE